MKPIVIIVNAPKGGVGKTTTAVNLSIMLAENNKKVVGYDVAQGQLYTKRIAEYDDVGIKVFTDELSNEVNKELSDYIAKNKIDFVLVDTDDYFDVQIDFFDKFIPISKEVIIIVPFPNGFEERERIPKDVRKIYFDSQINGQNKKISIFCNQMSRRAKKVNIEIQKSLQKEGIEKLLAKSILSSGSAKNAPYFVKDSLYNKQLKKIIKELKIL